MSEASPAQPNYYKTPKPQADRTVSSHLIDFDSNYDHHKKKAFLQELSEPHRHFDVNSGLNNTKSKANNTVLDEKREI